MDVSLQVRPARVEDMYPTVSVTVSDQNASFGGS